MPFAPTAGTRFGYVAETTPGLTPATPVFKPLRVTGAGMRTNKLTGQSDEIRADRNVSDEFMLGQDVAGSYDFELSYGSFDDFLAAALFSDWATDVLKNGVTPKSFTIEETLRVGGVQNSFSRYTGVQVDSISLNVTARSKVTGSMNLMGQKEALAGAIIAGATYPAAGLDPIMTASAHVSTLTVGGGAYKVRSLSLEITNNIRTRPVVGSLYSEEMGVGRFGITGTIECYFDSNPLYQSVLDHGGGAIALTIGVATGKKYTFNIPRAIFLNGERRRGGVDDDVMVSIPFRGVYDTATAASLQITRAVP